MTALSLHDLTRQFAGAGGLAVDRLTLSVAPGSLTALLGPSGCGKTTVMRMIAGLDTPTAGDVQIGGRSVLGLPPERRGAVMVFQNHLLFPFQTVAENVGFGLRMRHVPKPEIARRVAKMLALVQLPDVGARRPADLSGGQQQRVALARALVVAPQVLLLDEPLSQLDAHLRHDMRDLIRSLQQQLAITTLFVTHDQDEAVMLADRVALMLDGRLRQHDAPAAFYDRPADAAVVRFFGGQNLVPGRAVAGRFDCALGQLALPEGVADGPGLLTIRPESLRPGPGENAVTALVTARSYLGAGVRLTLQVQGTQLQAMLRHDEAAGLGVGDSLLLRLPRQALWVVPPEG
ncbi:MAG: ABC transporter ATP-binding protein [Rhodobacteraceae bacterium]|nr:ABC transporter ATP-binding protein [Paracoccaceae bacterium]